ncbi:MAG TPA: BREX-1 system adenine-specific DNA-methyltransferase PglX [Coprobacillaceae bacterium]|nr:BREX-1 system adenine-specific DNA-methyltransferase PglX [Coprobacillaceae bacterium]
MDRIKSLLTVPYNKENFQKFSVNFLKSMDVLPLRENDNIPSSFRKTIESYTVFGYYTDKNGSNIIVLSVKVKDNSSAQKAQRHFVSYLLANEFLNYNAALVAYYDNVRKNWKLSFVTIEYEFGETGVELKFKPAKRFSFLVGEDEPTRTYIQQLNPIYESNNNPSLEELTEAFSVSKLSKTFYEDYKNKYYQLYDYLIDNKVFRIEAKKAGYLSEDEIGKFTTTFCKKTLGQIVFLHFVQKKGWLGVTNKWGDGDKQYIMHSTETFKGNNYFNDFLEPLFYTALNSFREEDEYLGKKVPFLNGGLFQPIESYDWENTNFNIPNDFWFNDDETGLLNVLSQYNFTVDEADPDEQEVAIDPEMLGKIFESLLDTKDRSALGAFYTPREIVHFMCEEALASRISKYLNLDFDSILNYIRYGDALEETDFIKEFANDIDEYVEHLTIVDPAVGSGAFLVGMLNQIVKLRIDLQKYTDKPINKYDIKIQAIQNSLYGVDLEYDAVEIAKLRLWLSLIVDQETNGKAPKPLPNLNFHLRVGNSLVDSFDNIKLWNIRWRGSKKKAKTVDQLNLFNVETVAVIMERLKEAKVKFFNTSDEKLKKELSLQIEREQIELIRSELVAKNKFDIFQNIEEMLKKKTKPFFIWELEFEEVFENGGFDIVIANPPYVQLQKDNGKLANELQNQGYETFARTGDIYCIFYEKAIDLLKDKGVLCFITSNKWMRAGYGEKLRGFLAENCNPIKLIDFAGNKIFESATVDVNILLASKEKNVGETLAVTIDDGCTNNLSDYLKQHYTKLFFSNSHNWVILHKDELIIKNKINDHGIPLSKWKININRGILTGYNKAFIIDETTKNILIESDPKSAELIRPILRGKDIQRYSYKFENKYLICTFPSKHYNIDDYPSIRDYLLLFDKRKLAQSGEKNIDGIKGFNARKKTNNKWFETQDQINYSDDFNKQKLIWTPVNSEYKFTVIPKEYYFNNSIFMITGEDLYYLCGILNSSLYQKYFKIMLTKGKYNYGSAANIKQIPIITLPKNKKDEIEKIVKKILSEKRYDLISQIDRLIDDELD